MRKAASRLLLLLALSGCALYSDVSVSPLLLTPTSIERGADIQASLRRADYMRAIELAAKSEGRVRRNANDLAAVGTALLAAGRFDDARAHLRAALDLNPPRTQYALIAWDLAQVEYLVNNYETSLEWARIADEHGLGIKKWHLEYLEVMSRVPAYRFTGMPSARLPLRFGRPDVPRIDVRVNRTNDVQAVIDTGAVLSIVSDRFAKTAGVQPFGVKGVFYGLLGEPIPVEFAIVDVLELGDIVVEKVPVAIMPDDQLRFFITEKEKKEFRMDMLLGVNLLKEMRIALNFDRHVVEFTKLTASDRRPVAEQNLFYSGFRPHVRGTINRRGWFLFILDTGSEVTFLNEKHLAAMPLNQHGPRMHDATLQGLGGAKKRGAKLEGVELGLDRWAGSFKTLPMYFAEDKDLAVGIIGENYLRNFNVVLDFGRMRLDLVRR